MANIEITDQGGGGALADGILQIANGVPLDATLRNVADQNNTNSPLKLSTTLVQTTSTLQITTDDNPYIDAEDGAGNNRFTIGRASSSQQVNVDFASNPVGSTTIVGGIRTYKDGVNLATTMVFREDGNIGIGETTSPSGLLHVDGGAVIPRIILDADTNVARIFSFRTNDLPRWAFRIDDNETGSNAGSNFAIRRYNDAGTFVDAPLNITRSSGNIGVNTTTTTGAKLTVTGTGATSATTSLLVQNSSGNQSMKFTDDGALRIDGVNSGAYGLAYYSSNVLRFGVVGFGGVFIDSLTVANTGIITTCNSSNGLSVNSAGESAMIQTLVMSSKTYAYVAKGSNGVNQFRVYDLSGTQIGGGTKEASAYLQVDSTTQGFLPPRMTTAQKLAIATPAAGLMVYDTNLNKLCVYTTAWETITSV